VPVDAGGGLQIVALDSLGAVRGPDVVIAESAPTEDGPALIEDVVATATGGRVGLGWIVRSGGTLRAQASISSTGVEGFSPRARLGETVALGVDPTRRGRIAIWPSGEGSVRLLHRLTPARCGATTCARVATSELDGVSPTAATQARLMEIEAPCEPLIVGAIGRAEAFFHGTCALAPETGAPATTIFAIDSSIAPLASAPEVLAGCTPIAMAPAGGGGAIAIARCGDTIGAAEIGPRGDVVGGATDVTRVARCEEGHPVLELTGTSTRVVLGEPTSRIEALLPETIAPPGARAAWTGDAILVASVAARDLSVHRYQCELTSLVRSDMP
jgi:hypothetical protein